jgi:hypothetical protein
MERSDPDQLRGEFPGWQIDSIWPVLPRDQTREGFTRSGEPFC